MPLFFKLYVVGVSYVGLLQERLSDVNKGYLLTCT